MALLVYMSEVPSSAGVTALLSSLAEFPALVLFPPDMASVFFLVWTPLEVALRHALGYLSHKAEG